MATVDTKERFFKYLKKALRNAISCLHTKLRGDFFPTTPAQHTLRRNSYRQLKSSKYRPPTKRDIFIPPEQRLQGCDIRNYTNDENFEKNDFSANVNDFGISKRDSRTYTEYT